jgi:hypothetical protein
MERPSRQGLLVDNGIASAAFSSWTRRQQPISQHKSPKGAQRIAASFSPENQSRADSGRVSRRGRILQAGDGTHRAFERCPFPSVYSLGQRDDLTACLR